MPYFLVTQTTLVEAEDETAAAAKTYEMLTRSDQVTFAVRSDEQRLTQITVKADTTDNVRRNQPPQSAETISDLAQIPPDTVPLRKVNVPSSAGGSRPSGMIYGTAAGAIVVFYAIVHYLL